MTPATYEMSLLALSAYRAALSDNIDEIMAIMSVARNRVLRTGRTYTQVLEEFEVNRPWPAINNPVLVSPQNGILAQVESVYKNEAPDFTSNHLHKNGALYFGRVQDHQNTGDWLEENILKNQEEHGLIGSFGTQQFFE